MAPVGLLIGALAFLAPGAEAAGACVPTDPLDRVTDMSSR